MKSKENYQITNKQFDDLANLAREFNRIGDEMEITLDEIESLKSKVDRLHKQLTQNRIEEENIYQEIAKANDVPNTDTVKMVVFTEVVKRLAKK